MATEAEGSQENTHLLMKILETEIGGTDVFEFLFYFSLLCKRV